jgi:outer membrane protein
VEARQNLVAASNQFREARAAYWPAVDASASYSRRTSNTQGAPSSSHSSDSYNGSLDLSVLIYDFGKTPAVVREAYEHQLAATENLRAAQNDSIFGVRGAFYDLCKQQELLQVADDAVRQYQAHLKQAQAFVEVGRRTRYDATKAEVDLGNAQLDQINARNAVIAAKATLNRSLGLAERPEYRVGDPPTDKIAGTLDELMTLARERHPKLRALKAQERAASAAVDAAIADLYPSLGLKAQYAESGSQFPLIWNWSAGAQSVLQLFTGWLKTSRINETAAQLRVARTQVADEEQQIYLDLSQALNTLDGARQRMELTDLILRQAKESMDLVNERYKVGQASAVEVTDAEVTVTSARANQVTARFDYQTAVAQIKHAIGDV